ncbi:MAG: hypothetical protein ACREEM_54130 [Blastocatellia bacterium]
MKQTIIALALLCLLAEAVALFKIQDIGQRVSGRGDVVTFASDGVTMKIDGQNKTFNKGTYVMTSGGLAPLEWYWMYQHWYLTATLPIAAALLLLFAYRSAKKKTGT